MTGQLTHPPTTTEQRGQILLDISNAIVRLHKDFYGKGPTKARTQIAHDLVTVVLEGGFTQSEKTLHAHGHDREVAESRFAMQKSVEAELRAVVEGLTGRSIRSFMSAHDPGEGIQVEVFVLDPPPGEERFHGRDD